MSFPFHCCWLDSICYTDQREDEAQKQSAKATSECNVTLTPTPITILPKGNFMENLIKSFKNIKKRNGKSRQSTCINESCSVKTTNVDSSNMISATKSILEESTKSHAGTVILNNDIAPNTPSTITSYSASVSTSTSFSSENCSSLNSSNYYALMQKPTSITSSPPKQQTPSSLSRQLSLDLSPILSASSSCSSSHYSEKQSLKESNDCKEEIRLDIDNAATRAGANELTIQNNIPPIQIVNIKNCNDNLDDRFLNSPTGRNYQHIPSSPSSTSRCKTSTIPRLLKSPLSPTNKQLQQYLPISILPVERQIQIEELPEYQFRGEESTDEIEILLEEPPELQRFSLPQGFLSFFDEQNQMNDDESNYTLEDVSDETIELSLSTGGDNENYDHDNYEYESSIKEEDDNDDNENEAFIFGISIDLEEFENQDVLSIHHR